MYVCRFDHPFSAAYYEVIDELDQENKKRQLMMACQGADNAGLFLTPLIQELMEYNHRSITPAISKWLELPADDSFMPQESVSVFVYAHIAMGKLSEPLPTHLETNESQAKAAMAAFGRLYYWIHRQDLMPDERDRACSPDLEMLLDSNQRGAASALRMLTKSIWGENDAGEAIIRKFPQAMANICRNALRAPDHQVSYFPQFIDSKLDILLFSINWLGHAGGMEDVPYLRQLVEDAEVGESAITAIHLIEQKALNNND